MADDRSQRKESFLDSVAEAAVVIRGHVEKGSFIFVVSHLDADGLAAAGVVGKMLARVDAYFRIRIAKQIEEPLIEELASEKASLLVFTDLGSGYLDLLKERLSNCDIVVLDHHPPIKTSFSRLTHVNPHLQGFDGAREISGSGVAYLTAKALDDSNVDLACVAAVGALGDMQDGNQRRRLSGFNEGIVNDAVEAGYMQVGEDLIFYGRETRPVHKALAYTTNPFIPGLSGEEDKCLGFLVNLGIDLKRQDKWKTLTDLTIEEKQKIFSELAKFLVSKGLPSSATLELIGTVYTLIREDRWTPLRDAREFSSLLNACGRMGKAGLGVAICMGDRGKALEHAQEVYDDYKKTLAGHMNWLTKTPEAIQELKAIYIVRGEGVIDEKMLGAVSSLLTTTGLFEPSKPIVALTSATDGMLKVSGRVADRRVGRELNLGAILKEASEKFSGRGGGHDVAAGAQIPQEHGDEFVELVDQLVKERFQREAE